MSSSSASFPPHIQVAYDQAEAFRKQHLEKLDKEGYIVREEGKINVDQTVKKIFSAITYDSYLYQRDFLNCEYYYYGGKKLRTENERIILCAESIMENFQRYSRSIELQDSLENFDDRKHSPLTGDCLMDWVSKMQRKGRPLHGFSLESHGQYALVPNKSIDSYGPYDRIQALFFLTAEFLAIEPKQFVGVVRQMVAKNHHKGDKYSNPVFKSISDFLRVHYLPVSCSLIKERDWKNLTELNEFCLDVDYEEKKNLINLGYEFLKAKNEEVAAVFGDFIAGNPGCQRHLSQKKPSKEEKEEYRRTWGYTLESDLTVKYGKELVACAENKRLKDLALLLLLPVASADPSVRFVQSAEMKETTAKESTAKPADKKVAVVKTAAKKRRTCLIQ